MTDRDEKNNEADEQIDEQADEIERELRELEALREESAQLIQMMSVRPDKKFGPSPLDELISSRELIFIRDRKESSKSSLDMVPESHFGALGG